MSNYTDINGICAPPRGYVLYYTGIGFIPVRTTNGPATTRPMVWDDSDHRHLGLQPAKNNPRMGSQSGTSTSRDEVILMYTNTYGETKTKAMLKSTCLQGWQAMAEWGCFVTNTGGTIKAVYNSRLLELNPGDDRRYPKLKDFLLQG